VKEKKWVLVETPDIFAVFRFGDYVNSGITLRGCRLRKDSGRESREESKEFQRNFTSCHNVAI
jgi:hypothetical protein